VLKNGAPEKDGRRAARRIVIEHPVRRRHRCTEPGRVANPASICGGAARIFGCSTTGHAREQIPVIVGGGVNSHENRWRAGGRCAAARHGVAVTEEGDAHPNFKRVLAEAKPEDIATFMSVAGLPARAVKTPWLVKPQARGQAAGGSPADLRCAIGRTA
jgi:nitronate monooxygenase